MVDDERYLQLASAHFSLMFNESGGSARGVDWDSAASQQLRFEQLCRFIAPGTHYSINDIGCGYGALVDFLSRTGGDFSYHGNDVASTMIEAAKSHYAGRPFIQFSCTSQVSVPADYSVASGIFHKRFGRTDGEMLEYQLRTLDMMDRASILGFSFNSFSRHSAAERQRDDLFYADPCLLFDHCRRNYASHVALLHDYDPLDFTIVVKKVPPAASRVAHGAQAQAEARARMGNQP